MKCEHVEELLKAESDVMLRHLREHKYFQHITDDNIAIMDFIEKYGWLMREMYCEFICPDKDKCDCEHLYFNSTKDKK